MKFIYLNIFLWFGTQIFAQTAPPDGLSGSDLRTWYKQNWYDGKHSSLGYNEARRKMYGVIDIHGSGKVTCVYTGFLDDGGMITFPDPINAEHTVPQSFFSSSSVPRSDIHHLFPTHKDVNSARGSFPFAELSSSQTDKWYYISSGNTFVNGASTAPSNVDESSKLNTGTSFEPPEAHKGNVARAIFYFYTMYPEYSSTMSNIGDMNTLYQWHLNDPVDTAEEQRNIAIEAEQGNRNPYIDYPLTLGYAWGFTTPPPSIASISFNTTSSMILEPETATSSHLLTIEINPAPTNTVTVEVALDNTNTTAQTEDYSFSTTTLTFNASTSSQELTLIINSDDEMEDDETVGLTLQNVTGDAQISNDKGEHIVTITNNLTSLDNIATTSFFEIFPNPTHGNFSVKNKTNQSYHLKIYDTKGKIWYQYQSENNNKELNLKDIPNGIYLFKIETKDKAFIERIIIQD